MGFAQYHWILKLPPREIVEELRHRGGFPELLAVLLANRGFRDPRRAHAFLYPELSDFADPMTIPEMPEAVRTLAEALTAGEPIGIYADYDADGVTGAALLHLFLREIGARTEVLFPHRERDGYGFHAHLLPFFREKGVRVLVTVDCGITGHEAVIEARRLGLQVIVTDHHELPPRLPPARAVITGKRLPGDSPFHDLAGVGTVLALVRALRRYLLETGFFSSRPVPNLKRYLDLAALGTLADMVPLRGENRLIAFFGLAELSSSERPGIKALMEVSGVNGAVGTEEVLFRLAPRINAAGRLREARLAFELLVSHDPERARELAAELNRLNSERQRVEERVLAEALARMEGTDPPAGIVLYGEDWPLGVLGIAAGRIAERFYRPVVLLTRKGEVLKGSGRSIPEVDLYRAFRLCQQNLLAYGGHPAAGGLKISPEALEEFQRAFARAVEHLLSEKGLRSPLKPRLTLEGQVRLREVLDPEFVEGFQRLAPFGPGNPEPVLAFSGFEVRQPRLVAEKHLRFTLWQEGLGLSAVGFNFPEKALTFLNEGGGRLYLAASPCISEFQGNRYLELRIKDLARR
ncbi:single-stranded-DNA-specific exonuclease RecJ [Thermosulfurimonas sp. F29]|uniref:single-stranded-DNA-specific exonuclease RecJ n=1 Tax=Thermosulfurimonas sp. F29 TaxID=2867247 RepID=UPI001C83C845|nr:single-stranded-DNA-specific exonuclease RecJ [Thermosulfurimonas sp. F29]MBX6422409.1 single-stranded-DNA-specific exonuclease RecJ [Thermosulfurimonas sp. F29]